MGGEHRIRIVGSEVGAHTHVLDLNSSFRPDVPLLKLQVDIDWTPRSPSRALSRLEDRLVELCPGLRDHECRGHFRYHILQSGEHADGEAEPIEAALALAHLLEHVLIDTLAYITSATRLSGITGAHRTSRRRFDIFVECPDPMVTTLVTRLALSWIAGSLGATSLNGRGRVSLELVRLLYLDRSRGVLLEDMTDHLGRPTREVRGALRWLEKEGFARKVSSRAKKGRERYRLHRLNRAASRKVH